MKRFYRNVYRLPKGALYMPMNLHESLESAKEYARAFEDEEYAFTVVVDMDCFDIHTLPELEKE